MPFCIIPKKADAFKKAIANNEVDIYKLQDMTSAKRREFFTKWFGEKDAKQVNALYEQKLLLKNYERGMVTWAKKVTGMTPQAKRDLQTRVQNMIKRGEFDFESEDKFLGDLVEQRLGASVTTAEAKKITQLSNDIKEKEKFETDEQRIEYGLARLELQAYTDEITKGKSSLGKIIVDFANVPRSIMTSIDLSALLNQGYATSFSKEWRGAAKNILKYFTSKKAYNRLMADIITRENYELAKKAGLRITTLSNKLSEREEGFMSTMAEKIPGVKWSERAYTGFLNKIRMDTFDRLILQAQLEGKDVKRGSKVVEDIAKTINNFTGSGNLPSVPSVGSLEPSAPLLNAVFFSPRKIAATINMFNPATYIKMDSTARKYAVGRLINMAIIFGVVRGLAELFDWDHEDDPKSSNFGKVKIGEVWVDFTGGNGVYARFLAQFTTQQKKDHLTGTFKEQDRATTALRFVRSKVSPMVGLIIDLVSGKDYAGRKLDAKRELLGLITPMTFNALLDNDGEGGMQESLAVALFSVVGVNSYVESIGADWEGYPGKKTEQFREVKGEEKWREANRTYNQLYKEGLDKLLESNEWAKADNDEKLSLITKLKNKTLTTTFIRFNFKYEEDK